MELGEFMQFISSRRRVVAALAALGVGAATGSARAEIIPCSYRFTEGTYSNPLNNYHVSANEALFVFVARIKAVGDTIRLYADVNEGGIHTEGPAAIKGKLTRGVGSGNPNIIELAFDAPITAFHKDGEFFSIVQMAHDQNQPVGMVFLSGDETIGTFELLKGTADPYSRTVGFSGNAAEQLHKALLGDAIFAAELRVGTEVFSRITVTPAEYREFVNTLLPSEMNRMHAADISGSCVYYNPDEYLDGLEDCFLTSACCSVVGLMDDCWELRTLRRFRDGWMAGFDAGRADVARYYREAPAVAQRLVATVQGRARLLRLYWQVIVPAAALIRVGLNGAAYRLYRRMMIDLLGPEPTATPLKAALPSR